MKLEGGDALLYRLNIEIEKNLLYNIFYTAYQLSDIDLLSNKSLEDII